MAMGEEEIAVVAGERRGGKCSVESVGFKGKVR